MHGRPWLIGAAIAFCISAIAIVRAQEKPQSDPTAIEQAIRELGDKKLAVREAASQRLWEAGLDAEPALRQAASGTDAEVRYRAKAILEKFRFGVLPNTSPEVLTAIQNYRGGDLKARQSAVSVMVERGFPAQAEQLLRAEPAPDALLSTYVTQLLLAGKIDERLAALQSRLEGEYAANTARLVAMLHRGRGDWTAARDMAKRTGDPVLEWSLAMEAAAYADAAEIFTRVRAIRPAANAAANNNPQAEQYRTIEQLGYVAALQFRIGNKDAAKAALDELRTIATQNPSQAWYCTEPFFLAGQPEDGMELMKTANPVAYFELLIYQQRYREALTFVGWQIDGAIPDKWLESLPGPAPQAGGNDQSHVPRIRLALAVGRVLASLGKKADAEKLFELVATHAEQSQQEGIWTLLATAEYRSGMHSLAFKHATKTSLRADVAPIVTQMFGPARGAEAEMWWWHFSTSEEKLPPEKLLERVHQVLQPAKLADPGIDLAKTISAVREKIAMLEESERFSRSIALADFVLTRQDTETARAILEPIGATSVEAAMRLADIAAEKKEWETAARWYQQTWDLNTDKIGPLYLAGLALEQAGRKPDSEQLLARARQLANTAPTQHEVAQMLARHGYASQAIELWETIRRTAPFDEWAKFDSSKQIGDQIFATEKLRAGELWDQMTLSILRISWNFREFEGYLQMPAVVTRVRAEGYAREGKWDAMRTQVELHQRYAPADIRLPEEVVPILDAAKQTAESDQLFKPYRDRYEQMVREFPDSSLHHNNLAWLCARCNRDLDAALEHARRGVELTPNNPGHMDTLAEVHFRRGERQAAIEAAKKCVELDPLNKFYRTQLQRFESNSTPESRSN